MIRARGAVILLGLAACASAGSGGREQGGLLLRGATGPETRSAVVQILEAAGFKVEQRGSGQIVGSTGGGLAPDGYPELIACGQGGEGEVAAGMVLHGRGVDRPTGRFVICVAPSGEGARLAVRTDFEARACVTEGDRRTCQIVSCESTGLLERRIMARLESLERSPTATRR